MYVEAFTQAKDPARPDSNEDRLVMYGDTLFSVIDGVTDKSGESYDGLTGGQLAGRLIEGALREVVDAGRAFSASTREVLDLIDGRFRDEYRRRGIEERAAADPVLRFGAQLAALFTDGERIRLLHVGDCGVVMDGRPQGEREQAGDAVLSQVRARVYHHLAATGSAPEERLTLARAVIVDGLDAFTPPQEGPLAPAAWSAFRDELLAELPAEFPRLPAEHVRQAARVGLKGLAQHRNTEHPLGHGCIDGTRVPDAYVSDTRHAWADVGTIELHSDGYFGRPARGGSVAAWEAHLARVEREDPAKVGPVPSTKGSTPGRFTDDRTILILRKEVPNDAPA